VLRARHFRVNACLALCLETLAKKEKKRSLWDAYPELPGVRDFLFFCLLNLTLHSIRFGDARRLV